MDESWNKLEPKKWKRLVTLTVLETVLKQDFSLGIDSKYPQYIWLHNNFESDCSVLCVNVSNAGDVGET